jgi:hypothetical protein
LRPGVHPLELLAVVAIARHALVSNPEQRKVK